MANLTGCNTTVTEGEPGRDFLRPMGLTKNAAGRTAVRYKDNIIQMTHPLPEEIFKQTLFDLKKEMRSFQRGVDRRHGKNLEQATKLKKGRSAKSLADPQCYDPHPTAESVAAIEARLTDLRKSKGDLIDKKGSRVVLMDLPDDVVNRPGFEDYKLGVLDDAINKKQRSLSMGANGLSTRRKKSGQPVPIGIEVDENQNERILYDQYPQWYRMSEYQENMFARSQETIRGMGMGKKSYAVHPKVPDYDFRTSFVKHLIALGERRG
ncbi:unnamed protein product [Amoebophrya sp. A25]|nr:unnamed protein product [Amoebophrya sp. A25]|eukprot:GSA25T00011911001.1